MRRRATWVTALAAVMAVTVGMMAGDDLGVHVLAEAQREFAFDLYGQLRDEEGNLFFSPYGAFAALAMSLAGARGTTHDHMAATLRLGDAPAGIHRAFGDLDTILNERGTPAPPYEGEGFDLHIVNAMWAQAGYPLCDPFVNTLTEIYGAGLHELDFADQPDVARRTINDWVSDRTEGRIENLLPEGTIDPLTRLVLTNAIYFNAPWLHPFEPDRTSPEPFLELDGETTDVPMMRQIERLPYAVWNGGAAVELPYHGDQLAMIVLVPDRGAFPAFEASLTAEQFDDIVGSLETRSIDLGFPRFEFSYGASWVDPLRSLGMVDPFDPDRADFSAITGDRDLAISEVIHKALVSVDEAGTEAAAATAVVFRATGAPAEPARLTVDRPFLFVIHDRPTGTILFVGRVVQP